MAAVWIALGLVHLALHEPSQPTVLVHFADSCEMPTLLTMQREMLAVVHEPTEPTKAAPATPLPPQSRGERRRETFDA